MANLKRMVFILGGKGGTGKTLHCRQLYYFLMTSGVTCLGFDADIENPEFQDYHSESEYAVIPLDFLTTIGAKEFFTQMDQRQPDSILVDMPGASGLAMREQFDKFGVFALAKELGYRVTIDTVLNNCYNTINSLKTMMDAYGTQADYVVVRSQMWAQEGLSFSRWEHCAERQQLLELNGVEIDLPLLDLSVFDAMHENALSFFETDRQELPFGDRILVTSFLNRSLPELQKAGRYLGLPKTVNQAIAKTKVTSSSVKAASEPAIAHLPVDTDSTAAKSNSAKSA